MIDAFEVMLARCPLPEATRTELRPVFEAVRGDEAFLALCTRETVLQPAEENAVTGERLQRIAQEKGVADCAVNLVWMLCMLPVLEEIYAEHRFTPDLFESLLFDIACKDAECRVMRGCGGLRSVGWHISFFRLERYALGRLQYEPRPWYYEEQHCGGQVVRHNDMLLAIHIPSGTPLTREARMDSYRRAFAFFGCTKEKPLILSCGSWLISPDHLAMLRPESNIVDFIRDFDMVARIENDTFPNAWRVFGPAVDKPLDEWPVTNSLQRGYVEMLKAGKKTANGVGILVFDGEKLLTGDRKR